MPDEQEVNCILGVCCDKQKRRRVLADVMERELGHGATFAQIADWVHDNFDLAPNGKLDPLTKAIADLARGHDYE